MNTKLIEKIRNEVEYILSFDTTSKVVLGTPENFEVLNGVRIERALDKIMDLFSSYDQIKNNLELLVKK
jgi:hypothetical protein